MFYNIDMNNIVDELNKHGYESYIVGGYVRDYLLSYESKDIDICTNAKIEDIEKFFKKEESLIQIIIVITSKNRIILTT